MLQYSEQYYVSNGIYQAFSQNSDKRLLSVNHSEQKITKMKLRYPHTKYESFTKENYIVCCLYIMFTKSPTSIDGLLSHLRDINFDKEVKPFKVSIMTYKELLSKDILHLMTTYGKPNTKQIFDSYFKKSINFYTLWWYLKYNEIDSSTLQRNEKRELQKIQNLLLYITFSEKSLIHIKILLEQSELLNI